MLLDIGGELEAWEQLVQRSLGSDYVKVGSGAGIGLLCSCCRCTLS